MDTDTIRGVNEIRKQGYWQQGTTLGEGGWSAVYAFAEDWKEYELWDTNSFSYIPVCIIHAESTEVATRGFAALFHLNDLEWEIYEVTRESKVKVVASAFGTDSSQLFKGE